MIGPEERATVSQHAQQGLKVRTTAHTAQIENQLQNFRGQENLYYPLQA
jgi:hypothetical protein